MKKLCAPLLLAALLCVFAACGGRGDTSYVPTEADFTLTLQVEEKEYAEGDTVAAVAVLKNNSGKDLPVAYSGGGLVGIYINKDGADPAFIGTGERSEEVFPAGGEARRETQTEVNGNIAANQGITSYEPGGYTVTALAVFECNGVTISLKKEAHVTLV